MYIATYDFLLIKLNKKVDDDELEAELKCLGLKLYDLEGKDVKSLVEKLKKLKGVQPESFPIIFSDGCYFARKEICYSSPKLNPLWAADVSFAVVKR
jgi:hypothetical protein